MTSDVFARPVEEEALFNPAFLSLMLRESAKQHADRSGGRGLPILLPYLVIPLALHRPTRDSLPANVRAQMGEWVRMHPAELTDLGVRAFRMRPLVSIAVCFGLRYGVLRGESERLVAGAVRRRPRHMLQTDEVTACVEAAGFLGRWFAQQGDPLTILAVWGLRS